MSAETEPKERFKESAYKCSICDRAFFDREEFERHQNSIHREQQSMWAQFYQLYGCFACSAIARTTALILRNSKKNWQTKKKKKILSDGEQWSRVWARIDRESETHPYQQPQLNHAKNPTFVLAWTQHKAKIARLQKEKSGDSSICLLPIHKTVWQIICLNL